MQRPTATEQAPRVAEAGAGEAELNRRLYMQLLSFTGMSDPAPVIDALAASGLEAVLYDDVNDPRGLAVLTVHEDPAGLVERARPVFNSPPFVGLTPRPEFTMIGRTYSLGYERDLEETLLHRPRRHALHPDWPWAIWYPLRRSGAFQRLPREEQMDILKEHGTIGMAYGAADLAHDVRLACHGLDRSDNDFVVGLMGAELTPLSKIVERMRKTRQTSEFLTHLGPFFVGRVAWRSALTGPQ